MNSSSKEMYRMEAHAFLSLIFSTLILLCNSSDPIEGRYSFSLTTFHPSGTLPQISHASKAAALGPPIIGVSLSNGEGIALASLQSLPSPLVNDDGTSRFFRISDSIVVAHTGVNADGRVVSTAAQRLAVEHDYTFEEEIPLDIFLEEMGLLFQEYTMKAGSRPFGCSLLVAYFGKIDGGKHIGRLYRIDPSGCVSELGNMGYLGRGDGDAILSRLEDKNCCALSSVNELEDVIAQVLKEEIEKKSVKKTDENVVPSLTFIRATLTKNGFLVRRQLN